MSDPSAPHDVTPPKATIDGAPVDYWGHSYQYGWVRPRAALLSGNRLYRAATGIFDVHEYTPPPGAAGSGGTQSGGAAGQGSAGAGQGGSGQGGAGQAPSAGAGGGAGKASAPEASGEAEETSGCGCAFPRPDRGARWPWLLALLAASRARRARGHRTGAANHAP